MKTVHHPTIPDHSVDVADSAVQDWVSPLSSQPLSS